MKYDVILLDVTADVKTPENYVELRPREDI